MGFLSSVVLATAFLHGTSMAAIVPVRSFDATFDDLTATPGAPQLSPVGVYDNLQYRNAFVNNLGLAVTGVAPESRPNAIAAGTDGGLIDLSVFYTGSNVASFSLNQFAFGCEVTDPTTLVAAAEACTIQVNGFRTNVLGQQVLVASVQYTYQPGPNPLVLSPMRDAVLPPSFAAVQDVTIQAIQATGGTATVDLLMDDFLYTTVSS